MTKEQTEVVRLHMRDTYDVAPWEWDSGELELAIYELITKSQAKNDKVLDLVNHCPLCDSDNLHQYKLHHVHCKDCKEDFNKSCG